MTEHKAVRRGPLMWHLPEGWPDGPADEVLGEVFWAGLRIQHDIDDMVKGSPAWTILRGGFNLRSLGIQAGPYVASLLFDGPAHIVAHRLRQILGDDAHAILTAVLAYVPAKEEQR
ncbi:hypothetical protein IU449_27020 [Nocardia higoensis]|uniref:Uncharacterized protein n=1 Tax=Nocardia higoensis TaxID=228599 RepID=A0ABS0DN70_9NOCA|nr:hypothetical protein [Nocardia higoensis]MBF6358153.1 hypothetical protein [Nocardia higoensis]